MSSYNIVLLPGDGIGPEVLAAARHLLKAIAATTELVFDIDEIACGGKFYLDHGSRDWPEGAEQRCAAADAILLGAVGWPRADGGGPVTMDNGKMAGYSAVIGNRSNLDLYANVRPVKLLSGVSHKISGVPVQVWQPKNVDMVILRENTEDLYCGMGGILRTGGISTVATDVRVITRHGCERIIHRAFEICQQRRGAPRDGVHRVTAIVKNNVLDGCRLFVEVFREIATQHPDIETELAIVDAFTQWLITEPERYDVCVTTNMFGDIVTDLASVLQGGMGMAVGCNIGDHHAMFEPIHGSAPPLAGKDAANPLATLLATAEMLRWLGQRRKDAVAKQAAEAIESSVCDILNAHTPLTADLLGELGSAKASPLSEVARVVTEKTVAYLGA